MSTHGPDPKGLSFITSLFFFALALAIFREILVNHSVQIQTPHITIGNVVSAGKTLYTVTRVIDGDTIEIDLDGNKEKIRLLGINTPETVDPRRPVQCFGKEASQRMKSLAEGESVYIEYDDTQTVRDVYDRLLAYVYLQDGQMLNRKMIAEGYAYEYTYHVPYIHQKEFRDLMTFAKNNKRGLWADETCKGVK